MAALRSVWTPDPATDKAEIAMPAWSMVSRHRPSKSDNPATRRATVSLSKPMASERKESASAAVV